MTVLARVRDKMSAQNLDAMLVTQATNRRYLSGFSGSAGILLVSATKQFLLTDSRYYERVKQEAPDWTLVEAQTKVNEKLHDLLKEEGLNEAKIGFEADYVTVSQFQDWQEAFGEVDLTETTDFVTEIRAIKTEAEIERIRRAISLADQAMFHLYDWIQPGVTEKAVAWEIESFVRTHGAEGMSFDPIVAAGPNGAMPHARPSDYQIQAGNVVVVDIGCVVDGYCSDLTRTFSVGDPNNPDYQQVWDIVNRANAAALNGLKAGITGKEGDALARELITEAGYGENFGHSLGHGVGLAIHELPRLSYSSDAPLESGMVVTVEPGIYLPGEFGVRIEDVVVIQENGIEVLTGVSKPSVVR